MYACENNLTLNHNNQVYYSNSGTSDVTTNIIDWCNNNGELYSLSVLLLYIYELYVYVCTLMYIALLVN